jgi:hypothetical protein
MSPAFMAGLGGASLIAMYDYRPLQYLLRVCHIGLHVRALRIGSAGGGAAFVVWKRRGAGVD